LPCTRCRIAREEVETGVFRSSCSLFPLLPLPEMREREGRERGRIVPRHDQSGNLPPLVHDLSRRKRCLVKAWRVSKAIKSETLPRGRALSSGELRALFEACADGTKAGVRDAALLAILYAGGLRRSEAVSLERARARSEVDARRMPQRRLSHPTSMAQTLRLLRQPLRLLRREEAAVPRSRHPALTRRHGRHLQHPARLQAV
jgi:integrase